MTNLERLFFRVIRRTPLKNFVMWCVKRKRKWKTLNHEIIDNAHAEINNLYPRPEGHAWWDFELCKEYQYDLSVIVPFYNTEKYAKRCIDSILSQKTQYSFEVFLIDDGSPDKCGEILDSYNNVDNIHVIHKPNGGASDARNIGIKEAKGEYVLFLDSDDYLYPDAIQSLMNSARRNNADIVEGGLTAFDDGGNKRDCTHIYNVSSKGKDMFGYVCGKAYKLSLFEKYCFPKGYWFEDTIIGALIFPEAMCSVTIPNMIYCYYINTNGITSKSKFNPKSIDTYYVFEEIYDTLMHYNIKISRSLRHAVIWQLGSYICNRIRCIKSYELKSLFVMSAELARKYGALDPEVLDEYTFWEREICEAFINMQYDRWKIASLMM
ncbi:MAG: glycosyltransferase family 2 protein [Eubacteriales bacterium]